MARCIPQATASMKAGKWEKKKFQGVEITDKTLGLIGVGNIGRIVCERARGLQMNVVAYDPFIGKEAAERLGAELVTLDELYARADFVTIHTPLTPETRGLINAEALAKMKHGVYLVNAARGGIVDEDALLAALGDGKVAGAALDVFVKEPPDPGAKLVAHERVVCTPHLGASTEEAQEKVAVEVAEQMVAFVTRAEVKNAVNLAAVRAELLPRVTPWLDLAGKLGSLLAQILLRGFGIDEVEIEIAGEIGEVAGAPIARAALAGLLRSFCDVPVNEVNASLVADERGLRVVEVKRARGVNFGADRRLRARRRARGAPLAGAQRRPARRHRRRRHAARRARHQRGPAPRRPRPGPRLGGHAVAGRRRARPGGARRGAARGEHRERGAGQLMMEDCSPGARAVAASNVSQSPG